LSHQVFIERCRDSEPETAESLAKAIAQRYGVPPDAILSRLKQGRFQVKAGLEIAAAKTFMSYLEEQGALCSIVDAKGEVVERSPEPKKEEPPDEDFLELSPADNAPELALMTPPPPPDIEGDGSDYESGLSAGFSAAGSDQDLGALDDNPAASQRPLRLETLDGTSEEEKNEEPNASVADVSDAAAFMPPDMLEEKKFELEVEPEPEPEPPPGDVDPSANEDANEDVAASSSSRMRAATSDPGESAGPAEPAVPKTPPHVAALRALSNHERLRFAVGIMLAIFVGFAIMSMVASSREASRYSTIIAELKAQYDAAETSVAWDALDGARATTLENLQVRKRNIVIMSVFVWLMISGLFAFLWLRVFDWTRWEEATVGGPVNTPAPS
jgi:hypothetical protein